MKRLVLGIAMLTTILSVGCTNVEPGYIGIKVNMYGSQKGVEDFPLQTGRVMYNPWTEDIYKFPTFMQHKAWTEGENESSPINEAITFNSSEGASITADVGLNYSLNPQKVPQLFVEFRQDVHTITNTYLRNQVRDSFNRIGGHYKAVSLFGEEKQKLLDEVKQDLISRLEKHGFIIDTISFIGSPRGDARVMASINLVIEATQRAIEAENKVRQVEAEAAQRLAQAQGEADSIMKVAEAQAKANKELSASITPELIKYRMLDKWDGVLPRVTSGDASLLLNIEGK